MTVAFFSMRTRLSRVDKIYTEQLFYFITLCTKNRRQLLANALIHSAFIEFCSVAKTHGTIVGRYVIMPDHIHFFVTLQNHDQLSSWIKSLKNSLSKSLRAMEVPAPHWQKGFFDHLMRNEESYGDKWEYVRSNSVRHNLAAEPSEWPFQGEVVPLTFA